MLLHRNNPHGSHNKTNFMHKLYKKYWPFIVFLDILNLNWYMIAITLVFLSSSYALEILAVTVLIT